MHWSVHRSIEIAIYLVLRIVDKHFYHPDGPHDTVWLNNGLKSHMLHCIACGANYSGSATYNGMDIFVVCCAIGVTLVKSLVDFASAEYTLCWLLNGLYSIIWVLCTCPSVIPKHLLTFLRWVFHADDMNEWNSNSLSAAVIYRNFIATMCFPF